MGKLVNKYAIAGVTGVIAVVFYVLALLPQPGNVRFDAEAMATAIGLVFFSVFGAVLCAAVFAHLCVAKAADLGILHDERPALMGGLFFTAVFGVCAAVAKFDALSDASPNENSAEWIYEAWGQDGDCGSPLAISRGASDEELVLEAAGARHVRRIIRRPTRDIVETDRGTYTHLSDGWMTTTMRGMEQRRFAPCGR